jgi:hypothetical protein
MRIGALLFGQTIPLDDVLNSLRVRDIDVVPVSAATSTLDAVVTEARRLSRADCDGVLLGCVEQADPGHVAAAGVLLNGTPLLAFSAIPGAGASSAVLHAAGALDASGCLYDRLLIAESSPGDDWIPHTAAGIHAWLTENAKTQRHRGLEAARKLYGQRLFVPESHRPTDLDAAGWRYRFGVVCTSEDENADFIAGDAGDVYGALTRQLLSLTAASEPVSTVSITGPQGGDAADGDAADGDLPATFARITRHASRHQCLLLRGVLRADRASLLRLDADATAILATAASPLLHAVAGDHLGAIRAACESLDIKPVTLRPSGGGYRLAP